MPENIVKPDHLFEVSWEVCNKVGGIHTVISTKALTLVEQLHTNYILIGPDVWRDPSANPEFIEDPQLFKSWKDRATEEGLSIKIGHWKINGNPIVIIVNFRTFMGQRDEIFKRLWEFYKLDSLSGQWDYIEPALFGWAAAKVIESFTRFNLTRRDKVVAQFHEWMTGTGLLYLKAYVPPIATAFTTHATVLGRSIAGNMQPLYGKLKEYDAETKAKEFNVIAKQSLERLSAQNADCFTTVSDITARECAQFLGKEVDIITPNGFEDTFVPQEDLINQKIIEARNKFTEVVYSLTGFQITNDTILAGTAGRYEFKNKGIDLFIDSLGILNRSTELTKQVVAFILIPANHYGPRKDLLTNIQNTKYQKLESNILTHNLHDANLDPILNRLKRAGITNKENDKVKAVFVPCYLNGNDQIFNMSFYDLLIGLDITIFPSYYEPYGYTPLESLAFHVPTVTTSLTGFGLWISKICKNVTKSISVIQRTDDNDLQVVKEIAERISDLACMSPEEITKAKNKAYEISNIALWKNLVVNYFKGYDIAISRSKARALAYIEKEPSEPILQIEAQVMVNQPLWKKLMVHKNIPDRIKALDALSTNLWWSWNYDAMELFEYIDYDLWKESGQNPIVLLDNIPFNKYQKLANNKTFLDKLDRVYQKFTTYMDLKAAKQPPKVAYFSMEYGIHDSLKIYSGGLGILAGDYLKEASDANYDIVGVGLLYRYGYFKQVISAKGDQIAQDDQQDFSKIPVTAVRDETGNWQRISIVFPGRTVYARIWKAMVGRVDLYLLDTDIDENMPQDKSITHRLYGGDEENRFKQELILGVGGIRTLNAVGVKADLFHCNEGHAAFIGIERLHNYIKDLNLSFSEALEIVRASSLFTTHTPVPAGHDSFTENMLRMYLGHYPSRLKISWSQFLNLGKANPNDPNERFSMSFLAANLSQEVNGVSKLHGKVSQKIFSDLWPGYNPDELHIGYVTNGVHLPTWTANEWRGLYEKEFGTDFIDNQINKQYWNRIYDVPDKEIWKIRNNQRRKLIDYIKERLNEASAKMLENPKYLIEAQERLNRFTLTIGFARRFATYKRAHLLFKDLDRLSRIINNPAMPVQFVFAGKAHPNDKAGQDLIKMIVEISKRPEFIGKILFLTNYDMELAKKMVQGVDIWLNTPTRPLEASGTSGEKAVLNGALHFSVLDGWWYEGFQPNAGWALTDKQSYDNQDFQDEMDAETIYSLLENEIAPLFYFREKDDVPAGWITYIKNSIARVASNFTMRRMLRDYEERFYNKLYSRSQRMVKDDFALAKDLASWKKKIARAWESIEVEKVVYPDIEKEEILLGMKYHCEIQLDLNELSPDDIGVEMVIASHDIEENRLKIIFKQEFDLYKTDEQLAYYQVEIVPTKPGIFEFGVRLFPKHDELPHRQDLNFVKWI
jgi:glycogen phosphorylase/synthase